MKFEGLMIFLKLMLFKNFWVKYFTAQSRLMLQKQYLYLWFSLWHYLQPQVSDFLQFSAVVKSCLSVDVNFAISKIFQFSLRKTRSTEMISKLNLMMRCAQNACVFAKNNTALWNFYVLEFHSTSTKMSAFRRSLHLSWSR